MVLRTATGPEDVGTPLHRDWASTLTRGIEPWRIFVGSTWSGVDGPRCAGRDGNVHMAHDRRHRHASHLPATSWVALLLLAFRIRNEKRVVVVRRTGAWPAAMRTRR